MPRPSLKVTQEQRVFVTALAAIGAPHTDIALRLGIRSPKTLRKHFRKELDLSAIDADARVAQTAYKMAISGESPAASIFWMGARGWSEQPKSEFTSREIPPFIVAQQESTEKKGTKAKKKTEKKQEGSNVDPS
jgi:hypothetical protein